MLEGDEEVKQLLSSSLDVLRAAEALSGKIEQIHGEPCFTVIASERYALASKIASQAQKQMEKHRITLLAAFAILHVPCSARVIILGLVAAFVGMEWALALYVIDIIIIFLLGRIAF